MSQIKVLFFGRLADLVSEPESLVSVDGHISAETLYNQFSDKNEKLLSHKADVSIKVAVNQTLVSWDSLIKAGDEVAFLPPVTGG